MEQLLRATAVNDHITASPFSMAHLDVAACYEELRNSKSIRPEDIVMRQALELYCSLISPPTTPTAKPNRHLQRDQNSLPVISSDTFYSEKDDTRSSIVYPAWEPGSSTERDGSYVFGAQHNCLGYQISNDYSWTTISPVSELDGIDFDMDDPFASYPLAQPLLLPSRSQPGFNPQLSPSQRGRTSLESAHLKNSEHDLAFYQGTPQSVQRRPASRLQSRPQSAQSKPFSGFTKTTSVDVNYTGASMISRRSVVNQDNSHYGNHHSQPDMLDSKVSGRKRAFSVVTFGKHRKTSSNNSTNLRISGPMPIISPNPAPPAGTFSGFNQTPRLTTRRESLGCLSPAWEENEDITPIQPSLRESRSRSGTTSSGEEPKSMSMAHKFSSRPEAKSIWKTLKNSSSRTSLNVERSFLAHSRQNTQNGY